MNIDNQNFSEQTLRGFLLKNVDTQTKNIHIQTLNTFLIKRVDTFWTDVVVPLRSMNHFDGNKINWYFEIYKEGLEADKARKNPFTFVDIDNDKFEKLLSVFNNKTLLEYLDLGTSFLTNTFAFLTARVRDTMLLKRYLHIYNTNNPVDWILNAEKEERGLMTEEFDDPRVKAIVTNIGLIISRRV